MEYANKSQITRIYTLLGKIGKADPAIKQSLVSQFTDERTVSTARMFRQEADKLIAYLQKQVPATEEAAKADRQRKKIIHYARQMGWEKDTDKGRKADMERINGWCEKSGYLHKKLNDYTLQELPKLVTQFEAVYKSYLKSI